MNPKTKKILMWICIVLVASQFAAASAGKLFGAAEGNFIRWGYNKTFMYIIGVLEFLGATGLLIPKFRKWAALGLIGIMIGAAYTHLTHGEEIRVLHNLIICLLATGVILFSSE